MTLLALLVGLPLFFAVAWVVLLIRGPRTGLLIGLIMCGVTIAAGYWSIQRSRASSAALGLFLLPAAGALSGALAAQFARLRADPRPATRVVAWLCLLAGVGIAATYVSGGLLE